MPRFFIEVCYKGTNYSGFQIQKNANSIQAEVEKALSIVFKKVFQLTGSSRTDAGVHALQNYFHFDFESSNNYKSNSKVSPMGGDLEGAAYNLNSILPKDIAIKNIFLVKEDAHCRYDVINREYRYYIYQKKDPFLQETAYYYPYKLDLDKLNEAAQIILQYKDFTAFSKTRTQVKSFLCKIEKSEWFIQDDQIVYNVSANRFLRGMVKGLVGTMLQIGRNKISVKQLKKIIENKDASKADFSPPSHGLFLHEVNLNFNVMKEIKVSAEIYSRVKIICKAIEERRLLSFYYESKSGKKEWREIRPYMVIEREENLEVVGLPTEQLSKSILERQPGHYVLEQLDMNKFKVKKETFSDPGVERKIVLLTKGQPVCRFIYNDENKEQVRRGFSKIVIG